MRTLPAAARGLGPAPRSRHDPRPGRRRRWRSAGRSRSRSGCPGEACSLRRTPGGWPGCSASPSSTVATASRRSWTPSTSTCAPPARPPTSTGILARLGRAHPVRRSAGQHPERELARPRRRPPARCARLLRRARPDRARQRLVGRRRGHADRGLDRARSAGDAAAARRRGRRPPGRAVPGLRARRHLAVRQRRRDVRCGRRLGNRRPGRGRRTPQHPVVAGRAGCCWATP